MADADLEALYQAPPAEFTALRARLAAAAKERGDTAAAKRLGAARKPTTAAWIVNRLVHNDPGVRHQLSDLGEKLRAAHAAMDGHRIRELTAEQRGLVNGLSRAALRDAGIADVSAAVRDDVTNTLQAAIADPDVTARIGHLSKAERWAGFGEFGDSTAVFAIPAAADRHPAEEPSRRDAIAERAERERVERAHAALTAAERAKSDADDALAATKSELASARLKLDDARRRLAEAEAAATAAEDACRDTEAAARDAAAAVKAANAQVAGR